jgi:glycosyltransferase involved in cell wall biosynthesis
MASLKMLFHRHFEQYSGGHGKVWDYFNHALALGFDARIHFTAESRFDESNPWRDARHRVETAWQPETAKVLFLAGMDWQAVPSGLEQGIAVVNLVQSVRHADPSLPLWAFLSRRAHRICVAAEVAAAITGTGMVQGPVQVIPAALRLPQGLSRPRRGVFVDGVKQPVLASARAERLSARGVVVDLSIEYRDRRRYLDDLASCDVAVVLPLAREGFYLPALEAMALGTPVVTLDAIGNREYLRPGINAEVAPPDVEALMSAVMSLYACEPLRAARREAGVTTAAAYTQDAERAAFSRLLTSLLDSDA